MRAVDPEHAVRGASTGQQRFRGGSGSGSAHFRGGVYVSGVAGRARGPDDRIAVRVVSSLSCVHGGCCFERWATMARLGDTGVEIGR